MDCARVYGNEALVGEALAPWIEQHGRDSVFVTSKIWQDAHQPAAARQVSDMLGSVLVSVRAKIRFLTRTRAEARRDEGYDAKRRRRLVMR